MDKFDHFKKFLIFKKQKINSSNYVNFISNFLVSVNYGLDLVEGLKTGVVENWCLRGFKFHDD